MKKKETDEEAGKNAAIGFAQRILEIPLGRLFVQLKQMEMFDAILAVYKEAEWSKEVVIGSIHLNCCPLCDQPQGGGHLENCSYFEPNKKVVELEESRKELKDYMDTLTREEKK